MSQAHKIKNSAKTQSPSRHEMIIYGAFKGMGDLLSAAPVIARELNAGRHVTLLCFPGKGLEQLVEIIDFGAGRDGLTMITLPVGLGPKSYARFFTAAAALDATLVWVSPHAPRAASSWKIPLMLWAMKRLFWHRAVMAGAKTERLAFLFDRRVDVDRNLPMREREWVAYAGATRGDANVEPKAVPFLRPLATAAEGPARWHLLIHPGAQSRNRSWPLDYYAKVVRLLPSYYRLAVLGLPSDIDAMRRALPTDREIEFLTGTLEEAIGWLALARAILTMNSGNVHFASVLGVPAVALFGQCDPATVISGRGSLFPIYERRFACQPCEAATCSQKEVLCMNAISPETVAAALIRVVDSPMQRTSVDLCDDLAPLPLS